MTICEDRTVFAFHGQIREVFHLLEDILLARGLVEDFGELEQLSLWSRADRDDALFDVLIVVIINLVLVQVIQSLGFVHLPNAKNHFDLSAHKFIAKPSPLPVSQLPRYLF